MKFAICNETFQDWPLSRAFEVARSCGYEGIEFAPFTLAEDATRVPSQTRRQIAQLLEQHQLQCVGLHWLLAKTDGYHLTSPDPDVRRRTAEYFGHLARLCRDLGGDILVLGSPQQRNLLPGVSPAAATDYAEDVISQALPSFQASGVVLALEPLGPSEGDFLLTADEAIRLAQRIDSPNVQLHLDVKAMSSEQKPIDQIIRDAAPWLVHFHANDPNKLGPGMGDVDFVPIFAALQQVGYDRWVSVEVFDYSPGPETIAKASIDYMNACLRKL